ncbi:ISL3 family transposase [Sedimentitalea sp. HM32M-2]|uniref:ISL3 family transposase n=1 Tax=Sedimentitalea sp. HM32M-2 TaxID=3351566 RepID=UPI003626F615
MHARSSDAATACPCCGTSSRHVHGRYRRRPADLPAYGRSVELVLLSRRFRCCAARCPAKIFAERFPSHVTRPYARRTSRRQGLVRHLGLALALGGRAAQALAGRLLLQVSKDTFLYSVPKASGKPAGSARVVGIDDRAWRKGQRYGRLICDLERRQMIDPLPDRTPATVTASPRARPDIEIVGCDRDGGYGGAVACALPDAVQVADRWHLFENASAAFLAAVQRSVPAIRKAIGVRTLEPKLLTAAERLQYDGFRRRQQIDRMVRRMDDDGIPINRLVRLTGSSRGLIRQFLRADTDALRHWSGL